MQHFQTAGFLGLEVSRLAAAPRRRSTNSMYDDKWLLFAGWAAKQGTDPLGNTTADVTSSLFSLVETHHLSPQTFKGYQPCLASVVCPLQLNYKRPKPTPVMPSKESSCRPYIYLPTNLFWRPL